MPLTNPNLWRFMPYGRFIELVRTGRLYFASASEFQDELEGSVGCLPAHSREGLALSTLRSSNPSLLSIDRAFMNLKKLVKISCWHESEAECSLMWNCYSKEGYGIAVQTTLENLKGSLKPYMASETALLPEDFHFERVRYYPTHNHIKPTSGMLDRFFYKHRAFASEKEFRVVVNLRLASEYGVKVPENGIFVEVDINQLIESIFLQPKAYNELKAKLINDLPNHSILSKIQPSGMDLIPIFQQT